MKILGLISFWKLCKWVFIFLICYALIRAGVPTTVICLFLMLRLGFQLFFHVIHFIGGIIQIAVTAILIVFLFLIF
jgi:hypothetical protein